MDEVIYRVVVWLHVMTAIAALGASITYGFWIGRGARDPAHLAFALHTIRWLNNRIALPLFGAVLVTGIILVAARRELGGQLWLISSVVLYLVALALSIFVYTPTLSRQAAAAEHGGPEQSEYKVEAAQGRMLGAIIGVLYGIIVFLMVVKPGQSA